VSSIALAYPVPVGGGSSGGEEIYTNIVDANETWHIPSGYSVKLSPDLTVSGILDVIGTLEIY
jgi:hypothetical protein